MSVTLSPDAPATHDTREIDDRICFHEADEILEIDLSDYALENSADVNLLYDRLETRIAETGEPLWFFLINYKGTRIDPGAWFAHSRRGKDLNLAHSMGSVRYDACEETRRQIERSAGTDNFDPNLFATRDEAYARLKSLSSKRVHKIVHEPHYTSDEHRARVTFYGDDDIMEIDLTDVALEHSRDVHDLYDVLDAMVGESGRKWYFLINYENTKIFSCAWVEYAARGKALNEAASLGSVRFAPGSETETDIRLRAESGGFRPNIRNTREEALERIAELKRGEG
ncbi:MAG: hypothetical protein AAGA06_09490 [Pseudomonadota bacterium]